MAERFLKVRVKDAVLLALTKGQLRKIAVDLALTNVDISSVNNLTDVLAKDARATAEVLLAYLPDVRLIEVSRFVPAAEGPTREALIRAAAGDSSDIEPPFVPAPATESDGHHIQAAGAALPTGALVRWNDLVGVIDKLQGKQLHVKFDDGEVRLFVADADVLERIELAPGSLVTRSGDSTIGVVIERVQSAGYPTWKVQFPTSLASVAEMGLRPAVFSDPLARMKAGQLGTAAQFNLRSVAADFWTAHLHNELVSLAHARVDLKPHQVSVVHRVISKYPHRFLLCDEVGLGKTIEAAMAIKELRARGQAARVLILVPSGLVRQWQFELKTKFNESFAIYNSDTLKYLKGKGVTNPWTDADSIIASHAWASWSPDRVREITQVAWDMVIVDEAHHARVHQDGSRTLLVKLVQELVARPESARRACLMLTATPLQLDRAELYSLVEMLDPVLFASPDDFEQHISSLAGLNRTVERLEGRLELDTDERLGVIRDIARFLDIDEGGAATLLLDQGPIVVAQLLRDRHRLSEVMIRNRRSVVHGFQPRSAYRWEVTLSPEELRIHALMEKIVERGFLLAESTNQNVIGFLMVILQKLLASSPRALLTSLRKRRLKAITASRARNLQPADADELLESDAEASQVVEDLAPGATPDEFDEVIRLLEELKVDTKADVLVSKLDDLVREESDAKVLIFTEFRETQDMLVDRLSGRWSVHKFHGQMGPDQKDAAVESFRTGKGVQILVSTEAGGEGRNFQFCHLLVNYDLPWNPMRVEQRIGRVDRIGQEHPITIFNFHVQGTIEGRILDVLEKRIKVFEEAVGGLDPILGLTEDSIKNALKLAHDERDRALEKLGKALENEIRRARDAERKLQDFIMQDKSYASEIAQMALQAKSPISQQDFERFLTQLLTSVNTYVGQRLPNGERRIVFNVPFVIEHPELIKDGESLRVCFDPRLHVDSELVQYLGFGHPVIDALVRRVTEEKSDGMAAVRHVPDSVAPPGWQFNWLISVGGLKPKKFVFPTFVSDAGELDDEAGRRLLAISRQFGNESSETKTVPEGLDAAHVLAQRDAILRRDSEVEVAREMATERADIEDQRSRNLHRHRTTAATDRIAACAATLERLRTSEDTQVRQVIPLWEANLSRAEGELQAIDDDLRKSLTELASRRNPTAEFELLNMARIESAPPT
jgi:superfamily II DNA or RNA helicase